MPWINHLPPVCWSTFGILVWNDSGYVNLTQWWYFFIIFEYILHISTPHIMIFCFPLPYFPLSTSALFLLSTLVLTLYIDVVLSLSIRVYAQVFSCVWNFETRFFLKFVTVQTQPNGHTLRVIPYNWRAMYILHVVIWIYIYVYIITHLHLHLGIKYKDYVYGRC